ncbi:hypothetical protein THAR02_07418 [Trichoderma harzianum]|uniref:Uncharacterized protein n=1 Tax=Trichoderma harzianum TaxID=5544 RepID=A0A0F9XJ31_TRIHA|nr:hypothetical protein THAR02_07418 [Trichoderma harzianum]
MRQIERTVDPRLEKPFIKVGWPAEGGVWVLNITEDEAITRGVGVIYNADDMDHRSKDFSFSPPATKYVEYEVNTDHPMDYHGVNKYAGPPNAAQDAAWDALIRPVYFNASVGELTRAGESFENIAELTGGGYPASLGAYHQLHCVRQLRFWIYRDYYYPNLTKAEDEYLHTHLDHCTETLRLAIMCHGDTGMYSFSWMDAKAPKPMAQTSSKLACVKWSSIEDYARSRMIPTHPSLIHP